MASEPLLAGAAEPGRALKRALLGVGAAALLVLIALAVAAATLSGASLGGDSSALAKVSLQPLGGRIEHVTAYGPEGRALSVAVLGGRLVPQHRLRPGERISVAVRVRRPGWLGWALGSEHTEHLTIRTPVAHLKERWITVKPGAPVRVAFEQPVSAVRYEAGARSAVRTLTTHSASVSVGRRPPTGTIEIAAAARPWESVGTPAHVSWFPPSRQPVLAASPAPGGPIAPASTLYLTFSKPVAQALGSGHPKLSPATQGSWRQVNSHTLEFRPSGFGMPLGSRLSVTLPHPVAVTAGAGLQRTSKVSWSVPPGSTVRLHELLAQAGYLPVSWSASGREVAHTAAAEAAAAVAPPAGSFGWRYPNTPHQLKERFSATSQTVLTKGAIMKFENVNGLPVDGVAGAAVWRKLMADAIAGRRLHEGYSYVYVHREVPETATLWSAGRTIITAPANTGISGAETELGSFPVFEHVPEGTMSGTNPDGSHYNDPGIKWISYFNGGDALHNFNRSSFGSPQSLGCVELPLAASAEIWKYTPIGTVVTIET
jgi:hypothetical protein